MKKVAHIITSLDIGGAEMMLCRLLQRMDRELLSPVVITLMKGGGALEEEIRAMGIPVYAAGMRQGLPSIPAFLKVVRALRAEKPDVIQGWMYHGNFVAHGASLLLRPRPLALWAIHNSFASFASEKWLTGLLIRISARLSRRAGKIVYVSQASRGQHEALGFDSRRACVIPNGIDLNAFTPSQVNRDSVREELGAPKEALLIGLIGRYHPQKDHANFFKAAALLCQSGEGSQGNRGDSIKAPIRFVLAGKGIDSQNEALARMAHDCGLAGRVHFLGERRDMGRITAALDIAVSSSSYGEAFSLTLAEAMACGVPCVTTDVGDNAILVGKTGVVVAPSDPRALANGCACLVRQGCEGRRALGERARERIRRQYSLPVITAKYEELYLSREEN